MPNLDCMNSFSLSILRRFAWQMPFSIETINFLTVPSEKRILSSIPSGDAGSPLPITIKFFSGSLIILIFSKRLLSFDEYAQIDANDKISSNAGKIPKDFFKVFSLRCAEDRASVSCQKASLLSTLSALQIMYAPVSNCEYVTA